MVVVVGVVVAKDIPAGVGVLPLLLETMTWLVAATPTVVVVVVVVFMLVAIVPVATAVIGVDDD